MKNLVLYDSLEASKKPFVPIDCTPGNNKVSIYVCGLTPQDRAHLGHGITALRFDILRRFLIFSGYEVTLIQNVTDVDDKIITRALTTGEDPTVFTKQIIDEYYALLSRMNVLPVTRLMKVTEFIPQIIDFIRSLLDKKFCYLTEDGNVYFDISKKHDYGKLSKQNMKMLFEGVRKESDSQKKTSLDFALWKVDLDGPLTFDSPWGRGRPGWHIECSAMIYEALGAQIDIHGGGLDLKFPHHENEIAQSECHTGVPLARYWMHSGLLLINGQKMSKSLGNFITLASALEKFGGELIRFIIARHHYRSAIDFSDKLFLDNMNTLLDFHRYFAEFLSSKINLQPYTRLTKVTEKFNELMNNDINTPGALVYLEQTMRDAKLQKLSNGANQTARDLALTIRELGHVIGIFYDNLAQVENDILGAIGRIRGLAPLTTAQLEQQLKDREHARTERDFKRSDSIRDALLNLGIEILDSQSGTTWRAVSKL